MRFPAHAAATCGFEFEYAAMMTHFLDINVLEQEKKTKVERE